MGLSVPFSSWETKAVVPSGSEPFGSLYVSTICLKVKEAYRNLTGQLVSDFNLVYSIQFANVILS